MKYEQIVENKVAHTVLGLEDGELAGFLAERIKERSLSVLMSDLNNDVLYGSLAERKNAEKALDRLGFVGP